MGQILWSPQFIVAPLSKEDAPFPISKGTRAAQPSVPSCPTRRQVDMKVKLSGSFLGSKSLLAFSLGKPTLWWFPVKTADLTTLRGLAEPRSTWGLSRLELGVWLCLGLGLRLGAWAWASLNLGFIINQRVTVILTSQGNCEIKVFSPQIMVMVMIDDDDDDDDDGAQRNFGRLSWPEGGDSFTDVYLFPNLRSCIHQIGTAF